MKKPLTEDRLAVVEKGEQRPTQPVRPPASDDIFAEDGDATGVPRWVILIAALLLAGGGMGFVAKTFFKANHAASKKEVVQPVEVHLTAPPPPPPPPPPPQEQKKEEMVKQEKEVEEPDPDPAPAVNTVIKGPSGGGPAIAYGNNRPSIGNGAGNNKTKWGWYASQVQNTISEGLRRNPRTKKANTRFDVQIKADPNTGRVTSVNVVPTGDATLDAAIREALTNLQLQQPPPEGMPMPISLRITARRP